MLRLLRHHKVDFGVILVLQYRNIFINSSRRLTTGFTKAGDGFMLCLMPFIKTERVYTMNNLDEAAGVRGTGVIAFSMNSSLIVIV